MIEMFGGALIFLVGVVIGATLVLISLAAKQPRVESDS